MNDILPHPSDLGDGLALRWAGAADAERVAQFNAQVFRNAADDPPDQWALTQTREYMALGHPLIGATDFALVEDTATNRTTLAEEIRGEIRLLARTIALAREPAPAQEQPTGN